MPTRAGHRAGPPRKSRSVPNRRKSPGRGAKGNVTGASGHEGSLGRIGLSIGPIRQEAWGMLATEKLRQAQQPVTDKGKSYKMHLYMKEPSEVLTSSRVCVLSFPILQIEVSLALKEDSPQLNPCGS